MDKDQLRVTPNPKGMFLLNRKAYEVMNTPPAVVLLFDENSNVIGLKPAEPSRPNAFPVKTKDKYQNRIIYASPFCKHFKIKVERTVMFYDVDLDNEGILKLPLQKTTAIGRGRW
jgi:hypothetical protein